MSNPYEEEQEKKDKESKSSVNIKETGQSFFQSMMKKVRPDKKEKEDDKKDGDKKADADSSKDKLDNEEKKGDDDEKIDTYSLSTTSLDDEEELNKQVANDLKMKTLENEAEEKKR